MLSTLVLGASVAVQASASASPGTPAAVTSAIQRWEPKADAVIDAEKAFHQYLGKVPLMRPACDQPYARGPLARSMGGEASLFVGTTKSAEQGEVGLYALSKLFSLHSSKARYVAKLDAVGKQFDKFLAIGTDFKKIASDTAAGNCGDAIVLARADDSELTEDLRLLNLGLGQLLSAYVS
jgi:hypothetical protein